MFDSKIGGIPYMPADFEYPTVTEGKDKGEPIPFLAQINFRKAPRLAGFPTKGIIQFYCYTDRLEEFEDSIYDKREWENTHTCLGGYPELISGFSGDLYVNHDKLKRLFLQITGDSVKIPRILFFISEQDILEGNYTKLCLAR